MKTVLKRYPVFLYLLPVFFVLHGFVEHYDFVPAGDALLLTAIYIGSSLVFLLLFWLLYRNWQKAAVIGFLLLSFHFFFGSVQDSLRKWLPGSFITKYIFILPASFCLLLL